MKVEYLDQTVLSSYWDPTYLFSGQCPFIRVSVPLKRSFLEMFSKWITPQKSKVGQVLKDIKHHNGPPLPQRVQIPQVQAHYCTNSPLNNPLFSRHLHRIQLFPSSTRVKGWGPLNQVHTCEISLATSQTIGNFSKKGRDKEIPSAWQNFLGVNSLF